MLARQMAREKDATALIVGGGIAGLTAAIALRHYGIDPLLFERVDDMRKLQAPSGQLQAGSGLFLGYNVARAFRHLGLLDDLRELTAPTTVFEYTTDRGTLLGTLRVPEGELQLGIVRSYLHELLLGAIAEGVVQPAARLTRFEQDGEGVTAHFEDGREARGDVLIGADGLRSTVRRQLLGESPPRYAGYTARRGVLESDYAKEGRFRMVMGRGARFVLYPVGRWVMYWTAVTTEPAGGKEEPAELKQTVLERFQGFADPVLDLVEGTDASRTFRADIYDRDPVERWGEGRVTLLGDSAHPMTFDVGQGAGQSIEGAVFLAKHLKERRDDPAAALAAYEQQRIPRTTRFVRLSRRVGQVGQWEKRLPVFVRNNVLARVMTVFSGSKRAAGDLQVEF
jgi:2-polyprenyl-6-methoxyphenol hydroxylase-like FAD-dependent oxidoreductase